MTESLDRGISRRELAGMTLAGAVGLGLAGCTDTSGVGNSEGVAPKALLAGTALVDFLKAAGLDNFGDNPHNPPPVPSPTFDPKHSMIIHISSKAAWDLTTNHAHFDNDKPIVNGNPSARNLHAASILANKIARSHRHFKDEANSTNPSAEYVPVYRHQVPNELADYVNFAFFGCSKPHDIYVFFEHKKKLTMLNTAAYKSLVTFSKKRKDGTLLSRNRSFYNATEIDLVALDPQLPSRLQRKLHGTLLRIENHLTKRSAPEPAPLEHDLENPSDNIPIDPNRETLYFKMNFPYKVNEVDLFEGNVVIIDPDTGNGQGYDP